MMRVRPFAFSGLVMAALCLNGCGGGAGSPGDGVSTSPSKDTSHGAFTVAIDGGANRDVEHLYVTVKSVALHTSASQAWSSTDSTWKVINLSTPVIVDLAQQGTITKLFEDKAVAAATYAQIRLFTYGSLDALVKEAAAKGLTYNAQVQYKDGDGASQIAPLESADGGAGWKLTRSFVVPANDAYYMLIQADVDHSLVRVATTSAGRYRFIWNAKLDSYEMALGIGPAIQGSVTLCPDAINPTTCASDVVVSAQRYNPGSGRYEIVRQTMVNSSGAFGIYPLPAETSFDVVITGRRMKTMVIRGVTVPAFEHVAVEAPVNLGSLTPSITSSSLRSVQLSTALSTSEQKRVYWGQAVSGGTGTYEIMGVNVDPDTGVLARPFVLPDGGLRVATFSASGSTLTFSDVDPTEGAENFTAVVVGMTSGNVAITTPVAAASAVTTNVFLNDLTP
ncbi:DUF4382 domain-containing protein [Aquabacterium sp.]|uniref:DUF4382 domain-containing protein n=1 Tax=Aquabacterium sp. TaxID=1872578 RepID=UPI003B746B05